ncbi:hypothetical protein LEP1GSC060_2153 [Leptospira weilii serovar Ranarum str. ICFT]|uniref:Uncharacterized protein n=1 Tax=Leptospira weilii serovar Ranarum str. ICFT TaxID=1218598 RepID=N1WND5_9LEPT|nr:hypothetical protein [Leptospira weilii]EMY78762.1 hypothetical protein LEP1GSC060_2153 [Leptospira weilii serovar Ranarum str. ICFT]
MNPRSDVNLRFSENREKLSRVYSKVKLYCLASGVVDSIALHIKLTEFLNLVEKETSGKENSDFETEAMKLFLRSGILHSQKNKSFDLPAIEPSRMVPNPVDFGPLGELAEPKEKLEPVAVFLSVIFWGSVYAFLLYGLLR